MSEPIAKEDREQWADTLRHEEWLWVGLQEGTVRPADYRSGAYLFDWYRDVFIERYDGEE